MTFWIFQAVIFEKTIRITSWKTKPYKPLLPWHKSHLIDLWFKPIGWLLGVCSSDKMAPIYFLRLSKVWSMLHHRSVGRV